MSGDITYDTTSGYPDPIAEVIDLRARLEAAEARLAIRGDHPFPGGFDALDLANARLEAAEGRERVLREALERIATDAASIPSESLRVTETEFIRFQLSAVRAQARQALSTPAPDAPPESEVERMRRVCEAAREYEQHLERAVTHWRNRRGGDVTDAIMTTYYIDAWRSAQESFAEVAEALAAWKEQP